MHELLRKQCHVPGMCLTSKNYTTYLNTCNPVYVVYMIYGTIHMHELFMKVNDVREIKILWGMGRQVLGTSCYIQMGRLMSLNNGQTPRTYLLFGSYPYELSLNQWGHHDQAKLECCLQKVGIYCEIFQRSLMDSHSPLWQAVQTISAHHNQCSSHNPHTQHLMWLCLEQATKYPLHQLITGPMW